MMILCFDEHENDVVGGKSSFHCVYYMQLSFHGSLFLLINPESHSRVIFLWVPFFSLLSSSTIAHHFHHHLILLRIFKIQCIIPPPTLDHALLDRACNPIKSTIKLMKCLLLRAANLTCVIKEVPISNHSQGETARLWRTLYQPSTLYSCKYSPNW